ncbi:MAG: hypothetical protein NVV83_01620 [Afipia sp.]|nr:hypothetical protein [Afipia sp.]
MKASTRTFALAASAAISMFAAVAAAQAGTTISDQRYWPNEIRSSGVNTASSPFNAMASIDTVRSGESAVIYRGGPKTGTRSY